MKKSTKAITLLMATLLVPWLVGCTVDEPVTPKYDVQPVTDIVSFPDYPVGCPNPPTLGAPLINPPPPNPTAYAIQPIRGTCAGAADITAVGGVATSVGTVSNGSFCIEVKLIQDALNTVILTCRDAGGCPGSPTKIQIRHKTMPTPDAGISTPINLAKAQPVTSDVKPDEGVLSYIVDGDAKSYVKLSFWDIWDTGQCDACTWVKVDLGKVYKINKLRIKWGPAAGSDYAVCYKILLSPNSAPADPSCKTNADWSTIVDETQGILYTKDITGFTPLSARWASLLMYENGSSGWTEAFHLAEFEVWGTDPNATPPPAPDKCK